MIDAAANRHQQDHNSHNIEQGDEEDGEFWRDELQETAQLFTAAASGDRAGVVKLLGEYILRTQVENARNRGKVGAATAAATSNGEPARGHGVVQDAEHSGEADAPADDDEDEDEDEGDYGDEEELGVEEGEAGEQYEEFNEDVEQYYAQYSDAQYNDETYQAVAKTGEENGYYGNNEYGEGYTEYAEYEGEDYENEQHMVNEDHGDIYEQPNGGDARYQAEQGDEQYYDTPGQEKRVRFADESDMTDTNYYQDEDYWDEAYGQYPAHDEGYHEYESGYQDYQYEDSQYDDDARDASYLQQDELPYMSGALSNGPGAQDSQQEYQQDHDHNQATSAYAAGENQYDNDYTYYNQSEVEDYSEDHGGNYNQSFGDPGYDEYYSQQEHEYRDNDSSGHGITEPTNDNQNYSQPNGRDLSQQPRERFTEVDIGFASASDATQWSELDQNVEDVPGYEVYESPELKYYQYQGQEYDESQEAEENDNDEDLPDGSVQAKSRNTIDDHDRYDVSAPLISPYEESDAHQMGYQMAELNHHTRDATAVDEESPYGLQGGGWHDGHESEPEQYYEAIAHPYKGFEEQGDGGDEEYYDSPTSPHGSFQQHFEQYDDSCGSEGDAEYDPDLREQYEDLSPSHDSMRMIDSNQTISSATYSSSQDDYATRSLKSQNRALWYEDVDGDPLDCGPRGRDYDGTSAPREAVNTNHNPAVEGIRFYDRYSIGSEEVTRAADARKDQRVSQRPQTLVDRFRSMYRR